MRINQTAYQIGFWSLFGFCMLLAGTPASAIPIGDAFEYDDGSRRPVYDAQQYHPYNDSSQPLNNELNPTLNPGLNAEHPYPEYMNKFMQGGQLPKYYEQLLKVKPDDQIQSKMFDAKAFRGVRRIGVVHFENKTKGIEKDDAAGNLVAEQFSSELDTVGRYAVIRPKRMIEEYQMKIMTTPQSKRRSGATASGNSPQSRAASQIRQQTTTTYDLPYPPDKIDAVMIGAVTRYSNVYYDNDGKPARSPAVSLEFGAFLISTQTGEAIWGARFVGSQHMSITNLKFGKLRWLNKREFTQHAVSKVLKAFSETNLGSPTQ